MTFTFHTPIEGPSYRPHLVRCSGYWAETDGDEIRPGHRYFHPEVVELVSARGRRRELREIPDWLWEALSYKGEDEWRDLRNEALSERYDASEDHSENYPCYDWREDDAPF